MQYDLQELNEKRKPQSKKIPKQLHKKSPQIQENSPQPNNFWLKMSSYIVKLPVVSLVPEMDIVVTMNAGFIQDASIFWSVGWKN